MEIPKREKLDQNKQPRFSSSTSNFTKYHNSHSINFPKIKPSVDNDQCMLSPPKRDRQSNTQTFNNLKSDDNIRHLSSS